MEEKEKEEYEDCRKWSPAGVEVLASLGRCVLLKEVLKLSSLISVTELARSLKSDEKIYGYSLLSSPAITNNRM